MGRQRKDSTREPLLAGSAIAEYGSLVVDATDVSLIQDETNVEIYHRWTMMSFSYVLQFLATVQLTAVSSVMWPFLKQIDVTADETFFGIVMGVFSLASMFSSLALGYLSNRMHQTRVPRIIGTCATILGNIGTAFAGHFTVNAKYALLCFRFVTGIGGGCFTVTSSYIAMCSSLEERNKAVAITAATASASYLIGPGIASLFSMIGYPGTTIGALSINMYTAPAIFSIVVMTAALGFEVFLYKDHWISVHASEMENPESRQPSATIRPYDMLPVVVLIVVRFTVKFSSTFDQAISAPFTMTMFHWNAQEAIRYNGIIQSATGALNFVANLIVGMYLLNYIRYRTLMSIGLSSFLLYFVFSFSYPSLPPMIDPRLNVTTLPDCRFTWCSYTTRIYVWQYVLGYMSIVAALTTTYTPMNSLYSKLFGPRKQGVFQGLYVGCSQFAGAIAPVLVTTLFQSDGPRVAWALCAFLVILTIVVVLVSFARLITFEERLNQLNLDTFVLTCRSDQ